MGEARQKPYLCVILGWTAVARRELVLDHLTWVWRFVLGVNWLAFMLKLPEITLMVTQGWRLVRNSMCGPEMSDMTVGDTALLEKNVSGISDLLDAIRMLIGKEFTVVDSKKTANPRPMNLVI